MNSVPVTLQRFYVALLKRAGYPVSFDDQAAAVQSRVWRECNLVVLFDEYVVADLRIAGPGAVHFCGLGRKSGRGDNGHHGRQAPRGLHSHSPGIEESRPDRPAANENLV